MLSGEWIQTTSTGAQPLNQVVADSVTAAPDINAVATRNPRAVDVLIWNYRDDDIPSDPASIHLALTNLPAKSVRADLYRMDSDHSNSFTAWKKMGSPQQPTLVQQKQLEESSRLEHDQPRTLAVTSGSAALELSLPRQGVYLVHLVW